MGAILDVSGRLQARICRARYGKRSCGDRQGHPAVQGDGFAFRAFTVPFFCRKNSKAPTFVSNQTFALILEPL